MKYKSLFRVLQKVVGLAACAYGLVNAFGHVSQLLWYFSASAGRMAGAFPFMWWQALPYSGLASIALGLFLFFGGRWIANLAIPGNRPYCAECGYDLTRCVGSVCPECGTPRSDTPVPGAFHTASSEAASPARERSQ